MYSIHLQFASESAFLPKKSQFKKWAVAALQPHMPAAEVTIRIIDIAEMTELNSNYRHKMGPTNVLSFPMHLPAEISARVPLLGDIIICAEVVNREADEQNKAPLAHWAHMIVHGILHLLSYDHENDDDAAIMEALEIKTLHALGFANPYQTSEDRSL